jgi:hypothetical protein
VYASFLLLRFGDGYAQNFPSFGKVTGDELGLKECAFENKFQ